MRAHALTTKYEQHRRTSSICIMASYIWCILFWLLPPSPKCCRQSKACRNVNKIHERNKLKNIRNTHNAHTTAPRRTHAACRMNSCFQCDGARGVRTVCVRAGTGRACASMQVQQCSCRGVVRRLEKYMLEHQFCRANGRGNGETTQKTQSTSTPREAEAVIEPKCTCVPCTYYVRRVGREQYSFEIIIKPKISSSSCGHHALHTLRWKNAVCRALC